MKNTTIWANSAQMVPSDLSLLGATERSWSILPILGMLLSFTLAPPTLGQTGVSQIVGAVHNPTGAFIPNANALAQGVTGRPGW